MNTQHLEAFQLLEKASNILHRRITAELQEWDLSVLQFQALEFINSRSACIPSHCSYALNISTSAITRILDQLERRSLLTRERIAHDRRLVYLRLTPSGQGTLHEASEKLNERCKDVAARFPMAELNALNNALIKLSQAMETPPIAVDFRIEPAAKPARALRTG